MRAAIMAAALMLTASGARAELVRYHCSDFARQSDGVWSATRLTGFAVVDAEGQTQLHVTIAPGMRIPHDKGLPSPSDRVASYGPDTLRDTLATVLDRRCR